MLLTDGESSNRQSFTAAANAKVTIFMIGLGSGTDTAVLRGIADGTGGKFLNVADASSLVSELRLLAGDIFDDGTDSDGDGITDCEERNGFLMLGPLLAEEGYARLVSTNPNNANTDGDGYDDGVEVEVEGREFADDPNIREYYQFLIDAGMPYYFKPIVGDPSNPDTDNDGLPEIRVNSRFGERRCGTEWTHDSDRDGVDDRSECENATSDPTVFDPLEANGIPADTVFSPHDLNTGLYHFTPYYLDDGEPRRANLRRMFFDDEFNCVTVDTTYNCGQLSSKQIEKTV